MKAKYVLSGVQDTLEIYEDRLTIKPKGVLGLLNKGMKGTKEIPFQSIVAVQFKEAGVLTNGYIQFTLPGGIESRGGLFAATKDENTVMFKLHDLRLAKKIKEYIDSSLKELRKPVSTSTISISDELQRLANLKKQGILSDKEFQAAKKKLIGA